jgi:hypothetical protein
MSEKNNSNKNGRVIIQEPNQLILGFKDKINAKATPYSDAMNGIYYDTQLSRVFFSSENQEILQNGIRNGVYNISNKSYLIDKQDYDTLKIIMRSIFLQYSENSPKDIKQQVEKLNRHVLEYSIKNIYGEAKGYLTYINDVSNLAIPPSHPIQSRLYDKQLEETPFV